MSRTSNIHYIAPSAISITPNANGKASDLAVYVAQGAKIKVYDPRIFSLGTVNANYQEWTLSGRNRRLAETDKPYTIYARLRKTEYDEESEQMVTHYDDAYLVFAAQVKDEDDEWQDPYILSPNTSSTGGTHGTGVDGKTYTWGPIPERQAEDGRANYWWVKLGTVSLPDENGRRTVDLDTGILGTEQYNSEWSLNPDDLPLRVEIGCTIDDEDAGATPYVYWNKSVVLTANLMEGWSETTIEGFDHWEITRNTSDGAADTAWAESDKAQAFRETGTITLDHLRGEGDDFNGVVSSVFTVTAVGEDGAPLQSASVTILQETSETFELLLSTNIVSYSPEDDAYEPSDGITVSMRATDQRGDAFDITNRKFVGMMLALSYAQVGSDAWTSIQPTGGADELAVATVPITAFEAKESVNVRLVRVISAAVEPGGEPVVMELKRKTISFVSHSTVDGFLRKDRDEYTPFSFGIGGNLNVEGDTVLGDTTVNGMFFGNGGVRTDEVRSSDYTGDTVGDTGFLLTSGQRNGLGHSKLTVDELYVRMKAVYESLEVRKWSVVAGDEIRSCAANVVTRVDYFSGNGTDGGLLGYSEMRVPWIVKRVPFLLKLFSTGRGRWLYAKVVRMRVTLTADQLRQVRYCRCYFLADDGDTQIENWWQKDDLARCQTQNIVRTARNTYTPFSQSKNGNVMWWRKVIRVSANGVAPVETPSIVNCEPALIDGKSYHWFDVAFNWDEEQLGRSYDCMAGSDIPAAGDHAVQFGNTTNPGRMNLWITMVNGGTGRDYDPDGDAPCIKGFVGIYTFDLTRCYVGGHPCKMTLAPGKKYHFYGREFRVIKEYGEVPVPTNRGEWTKIAFQRDEYDQRPTYTDDIIDEEATPAVHTRSDGKSLTYARKCYWNDEVTHVGCVWLCSIADGSHWVRPEKFIGEAGYTESMALYDANGNYRDNGVSMTPGEYSALSVAEQAQCGRRENYTVDEPSSTSSAWTKIVDRGTSVKSEETRYQKKARMKYNETLRKYEVDPTAGTVPPALPWEQWKLESQIAELAMEPGDFLWMRTKTEYSDTLEPSYRDIVVQWGIDADGLAQNSYFLGLKNETTVVDSSHDSYLMPPTASSTEEYRRQYEAARPQAKWFDTFDDMVQANGGLGSMQGWNVWTKTVVHYDLAEGRKPDEQKPDLVNYLCTHIGADAVFGQEEYYMLAASDNFATVFGDPTRADSYYYTKTGIRWYTEQTPLTDDLPVAENYRLADGTQQNPNINTSMWQTTMPVYDNSTSEKAAKKYLWNFEYHVDGKGTQFATKPRCLGNHAKGITGTIELYAISSSQTPISAKRPIPADINSKNVWGVIPTTGFNDKQVWADESYDRAPTEALPYQWNWTRTLYSDNTYEDHYHVSAARGTNGEDGAGEESIFILKSSSTWSGDLPSIIEQGEVSPGFDQQGRPKVANGTDTNKQQDDWVPNGWTDNPRGISPSQPYEFVSTRKLGTPDAQGRKQWGAFSTPVLRSNWGKSGVDGDGVEYVFMRTKNNVAPIVEYIQNKSRTDSRNKKYTDDDYLPVISNNDAARTDPTKAWAESTECTDDQKDVTSQWPYEWALQRQKGKASTAADTYGQRIWRCYGSTKDAGSQLDTDQQEMTKWHNFAENAKRLDLSNEMDMVPTDSAGKITSARTITSIVRFYDGSAEQNLTTDDITVPSKWIKSKPEGIGKGIEVSRVYAADGSSFSDTDVVISYGIYSTSLTLLASKGQPIVQLRPSHSALPCVRQSDNTLGNPPALSLMVTFLDGKSGGQRDDFTAQGTVSYNSKAYYVRYSKTAMPTAKSGEGSGSAWPQSNSIQATTSDTNIYIAVFNSDGTLLDRETVPVVKDGINGSNSIRLDVNNEMDMVLTDSTGKILAARTVETVVRLYDGSKEVDLSAVVVGTGGFSITGEPTLGSSGIATRNLAAVGKGRKISYTFKKDKVMSDVYDITISYTHNSLPYSATFTVGASKGQAIFQLKPSASALTFTRNSSNTLVAPSALSLKIEVVDSNTQTEVSSFDSSGRFTYGGNTIYVRYSKSAMPTAKSGTGSGSPWTGDVSVTVSEVTSDTPVKDVYIAMFNSDGQLLDRETIPVVKDGLNGTSPWVADLDNEMDSIACDANGKPTSQQTVSTNLSLFYGSTKKDFYITSIKKNSGSSGSYGTGVSVSPAPSSTTSYTSPKKLTVTYGTNATVSGKDDFEITLKAKDDDTVIKTLHLTVNGVKPGPNGEPAVLYRLVPSCSEIVKKKNGTYVPSGNVTCSVTKSIGNGAPQTITSGFTLNTYLNGSSTPYGSSTVPASSVTSNIVYELLVSGVIVDRETIPLVTDGTDGTSPFIVDMDNEMDSVACDSSGNATALTRLYTKLSAFYGSTDKTSECTVKLKSNDTGGTVRLVSSGSSTATGTDISSATSMSSNRYIRVQFAQGATVAQRGTVVLEITHSSYGTRNLTFTINGVRPGPDGKPATIYNLLPSKSEISVGRTASGGYNPSTATVSCGYVKNVGGTMTTVTDATDQIDQTYNIYFRLRTRSNSAWATTYDRYGDGGNHTMITSNGFNVATYDAVEFILCTNTGDVINSESAITGLIDRETIPVLADGAKGSDSTTYALLPSATQIKATLNSNNSYGTHNLKCGYIKTDGDTSTPYDDATTRIDGKYSIFFRRKPRGSNSFESEYIMYTTHSNPTSAQTTRGANARSLLSTLYLDAYDAVEFYLATNEVATYKDVLTGKNATEKVSVIYTTTAPTYIDKKDVSVIYDGKDGNATLYSLSCTPDVVNFRTNAVGDFNPDDETTVVCSVVKTTGDSSAVISSYSGYYLTYRCYYANGAVGNWNTSSAVSSGTRGFTVICEDAINTSAEDQLVGVEFALSTDGTAAGFDSHIIARKYIAVIIDGRRGATGQGAPGKMFYSMGEWSATTQYSISGLLIPMVHYNDGEFSEATGKGNYYYLKDGKTAYGNTQKPTNTTYWTKATGFGVVITQGLFAEFAKLGKAIMSGDYMFSMNGRIGSTEYNNGAKYNNVPAYTYFKGDPSKQTGTFFNPNWWVDLLTGKMVAARGNFVVNPNGDVTVAGTIKANNLFKDLSMSTGGRQTVIINANGDCDAWIYVNTRSTDHGYTFEAGTYILASEYDVLVDDVGSWKTDENFTICTGGADEVWLTDGDITGGFGGINNDNNKVFLPQCSKYAGKKVTVYHTLTVTNHNAEIRQCDGAYKFSAGLTLRDFDVFPSSNLNRSQSVQAGETAVFYSTGNCWVMLAHWT